MQDRPCLGRSRVKLPHQEVAVDAYLNASAPAPTNVRQSPPHTSTAMTFTVTPSAGLMRLTLKV